MMHKTLANCDVCGADITNYYDTLCLRARDELAREYDRSTIELCSQCSNFFGELLIFILHNKQASKDVLIDFATTLTNKNKDVI